MPGPADRAGTGSGPAPGRRLPIGITGSRAGPGVMLEAVGAPLARLRAVAQGSDSAGGREAVA
jgi:hypothetical protein